MTGLLAFLSLETSVKAQVYTPIDSTYKLTFDEEFNGSAVNTAKWGKNWLGNSGAITKPVSAVELGAYDPAQCTVANGNLELTALQKTVVAADGKTYNYTSGLINSYKGSTPFVQAYGYFEARMYLPGSAGKISNWPAFWTAGTGTWPTTGEMDVMEGLGGNTSYHYHSDTTGAGGYPTGDYTGWHIFGALWEPGSVKYYYDGNYVGSLTSGITSAPMFLILNNGVSLENNFGGPMQIPATVLVDYVHVYSKALDAVAITPEANYGGPGDRGVAPVDTTPPSVPDQLTGATVSTSQVNLSWSASSDTNGVAGYYLYRNGVKLPSSTTAPRFSDTGLSVSTAYSYEVSAFDAAGNVSAKSSAISVTTQSVPINLVVNPGFEMGGTGWSSSGVARIEASSPVSGTSSAYFEVSSAFEQIVNNLTPNTSYTLTAYLRAGAASMVSLGVKNYGGIQIASGTTSQSYQPLILSFTTGATNTSAKIFVYGSVGNGRADDFLLTQTGITPPTNAVVLITSN